MNELTQQHCEACRVGAPKVTAAQMAELLPSIPAWQVENDNNIEKLKREYRFDDYPKALAFTQKIGELAEEEGHHPAILTEWGKVTVLWWSHKIEGLHRNDFIMAAKSDLCYATDHT